MSEDLYFVREIDKYCPSPFYYTSSSPFVAIKKAHTAKTYHKEPSVVGTIQLAGGCMLSHKAQQWVWSRKVSALHLGDLLNSTDQRQTHGHRIVKT
jgi:hypothetical protein